MEITEQKKPVHLVKRIKEFQLWIIIHKSAYLMKAYSSISATSHQQLPNTTITK